MESHMEDTHTFLEDLRNSEVLKTNMSGKHQISLLSTHEAYNCNHNRYVHTISFGDMMSDTINYINANVSSDDKISHIMSFLVKLSVFIHDAGHLPGCHKTDNAIVAYNKEHGTKVGYNAVTETPFVHEEMSICIINYILKNPAKFELDIKNNYPIIYTILNKSNIN